MKEQVYNWQHIALPLMLEAKEIESLTFIIDYSNNTGNILFTDLELKQGIRKD